MGNREDIVKNERSKNPLTSMSRTCTYQLKCSKSCFRIRSKITAPITWSWERLSSSRYFFPHTLPRLMNLEAISAEVKEKIAGKNAQVAGDLNPQND